MTYNVQIAGSGYTGWKMLERTSERQLAIFQKDVQLQRSRDYFTARMPEITEAGELVSDYKLLSVALRAFGLDADISNRAFIKKVLEADPSDSGSFVNRLSDKRYLKLNQAFNFGASQGDGSQTADVDKVLNLYVTRSFEKNIGQQNAQMELALNAKREIADLAQSSASENTKWYQVLGNTSLLKVFQTAFNLGSSFSSLPIERQLSEMKARSERMTGSENLSDLAQPANMEKLIKTYMLKSQFSGTSATNRYSVALSLLSG